MLFRAQQNTGEHTNRSNAYPETSRVLLEKFISTARSGGLLLLTMQAEFVSDCSGGCDMSKLERQLDRINGEAEVAITWPCTEEMYLKQLRSDLVREIDTHQRRVPIDLRGVTGAPAPVIDLLCEMKEYAEEQGKHLVVSHALAEMREALSPNRKSKVSDRDQLDASQAAGNVLRTSLDTIQSFHLAERQSTTTARKNRRKSRAVSKPGVKRPWTLLHRVALLGSLVLLGTACVFAIEWYIVFNYGDFIDMSNDPPPRKYFEQSGEEP